MNAREQLELERAIAIASELHPDHWPAWMRERAEQLRRLFGRSAAECQGTDPMELDTR